MKISVGSLTRINPRSPPGSRGGLCALNIPALAHEIENGVLGLIFLVQSSLIVVAKNLSCLHLN